MLLSAIVFAAALSFAETPDTLEAVTVVADKGVVVSRRDTAFIHPAERVSDVILSIPSLSLSDYGGAAGLKSVSLRGFGSAHTAVYIDGVKAGNVQSGQVDLGFVDISSFSSVVVDYAQNSISLNTARPVFDSKGFNVKAAFTGGSFGTYLPSLSADFKLGERLSLRVGGSATVSEGDYLYGDGLKRSNNDIKQLRAGADLFGILKGGEYLLKAYYNSADRGTPGSTTYLSEDRQSDENAFLQGSLRKRFGSLYSLNVSAKASLDNTDYLSTWGNSNYDQTQLQLNTSHRFDLNEHINLSLALGGQWDGLKSNIYEGSRSSVVTALAGAFNFGSFRADAAVEYNGWFDRGGKSLGSLSPSLDLRLKVIEGLDITAFGRRAYRAPTFNELYYPGYGNTELKPEDAYLSEAGVEYRGKISESLKLTGKLDGFYNFLKDKIVSSPTEADPNIWLPYNVGRAEVAGADATLALGYKSEASPWEADLRAHYSYQHSEDKTKGSSSFGQQLPYIARHSINVGGDLAYCGWRAALTWNYRAGRRDSYGTLPSWGTLDASLRKSFRVRGLGSIALSVVAKNLTNTLYESVRYYPMPSRSVLGGIELNF